MLQPGGGKTVEQKALELRYDPEINKWSTHRCLVHMDSKPLDEVSFPEYEHVPMFINMPGADIVTPLYIISMNVQM